MSSTNVNCLILGVNSFTGSWFAKVACEKGWTVLGLAREKKKRTEFLPYMWVGECGEGDEQPSNMEICEYNILDSQDMIIEMAESFKPEIVVNFIAQGMVAESWKNPTLWYRTNFIALEELSRKLARTGYVRRFVQASTPEVYGSTGRLRKEDRDYKPTSPYALSKAAFDTALEIICKGTDMDYVLTRAANVYGPGQGLYRIIPRTFMSCISGAKLDLTGGGRSRRAFVHARDVAEATIRLAENAEGNSIWHITNEDEYRIRDIVNLVCKSMGTTSEIVVNNVEERVGLDENYSLSGRKLRYEMGFKFSYTVQEGIESVKSWANKHREELRDSDWKYAVKL